jgi:ferredoxin-nitrate reductase
MDRQLDPLGSQLLHEELTDKGVDIYYNDEIERFLGDTTVNGVRLKKWLVNRLPGIGDCHWYGPNIELAKQSGIECKRGVVVDEYLRTNDPSVFAIGEIEFKGFLYGITAAAEQQAEIVARFLSGDISKYYEGSLLMNT